MPELAAVLRRGLLWWIWLLGALAIFFVVSCQRDQPEARGASRTGPVQPVIYAPITKLSDISDAKDRASLAGREVALSDEVVRRVMGDRIFTVGPEGKEIFVVLVPAALPPGSPKGVVQGGQDVILKGVIERVPPGGAPPQGLSADEARALQGQQVYVLGKEIAAPRRAPQVAAPGKTE